MKKFLLNSLYFLLILAILGAIGIMGIFYYFGQDLPDYSQLKKYDPPVLTRLYTGDGQLFAEYAREKRVFVPIQAIPKHIIHTFLVVEDENFYDHFGLSLIGIARAFVHNMYKRLSGSNSTMGGSTITQQVAKNFLLSSQKTLTRKIQEAILAIRIERALSKDKILELYLNEIYFGGGTYGVAAAALHYFDKSLQDLTVAEAAYLAALPKAPNNYHPIRNKQAALNRRNWVISRMLEEGLIDRKQALEAKKQDILFKPHINRDTVDAPYFAEEVRRFIAEKYGSKSLYEGGLVVHTTIDSRYQKLADDVLQQGIINFDRKKGWRGPLTRFPLKNWQTHLKKFGKPAGAEKWEVAVVLTVTDTQAHIGLIDAPEGILPLKTLSWARRYLDLGKEKTGLGPEVKKVSDVLAPGDVILVSPVSEEKKGFYELQQLPQINGALVVLEPNTGRILAQSGGFSYEMSEYNRATQAMRQTGSAFKPFTYLAAFEKGYSPASMILDAPFVFEAGPYQPLWTPQNIEKRFFGWNTLRTAMEKSMNASTVRLAHEIGMPSIVSVAKRFNIYPNLPPYLSTVLGSEETTLLQFVAAYGMLVNGGKKIDPFFIDRIQDRHGKTLFKEDQRTCTECAKIPPTSAVPPELPDTRKKVTDPISAYQIVSILEGAAERGTGQRGKPKGQIVGIKTGTTNNYRDVWTIGFSKDLVVGVYMGFDQPRSLGRRNTGGAVAGPVFKAFMEKALEGKPAQPFRVPQNTKFIKINRKTGKIAKAGDKDVILEAFKPDQKPEDHPQESSSLSNAFVDGIY